MMKHLYPIVVLSLFLLTACDSSVAVEPESEEFFKTESITPSAADAQQFEANIQAFAKGNPDVSGIVRGTGQFEYEGMIGDVINSNKSHAFALNVDLYGNNEAKGTLHLRSHSLFGTSPGNSGGGKPIIRNGNVECSIIRTDQVELAGRFKDGTVFVAYLIDGDFYGNGPDQAAFFEGRQSIIQVEQTPGDPESEIGMSLINVARRICSSGDGFGGAFVTDTATALLSDLQSGNILAEDYLDPFPGSEMCIRDRIDHVRRSCKCWCKEADLEFLWARKLTLCLERSVARRGRR